MSFLWKAKKALVKTWLIHIKFIATIVVALCTLGVERISDNMDNSNTVIEQTIETETAKSESTKVHAIFLLPK